MSREALIEELGETQSLLLALAEDVDETTFRSQYHDELSPLGWHLGHCVYTDCLWLHETIRGDDSVTAPIADFYTPPNTPKPERGRLLPPQTALRCHFHNTRNTGIANAYAALQAGVRTLDASVGGIGGCPFAPAATGNVATEDLLYMLERSGYSSGVSLDGAIDTARWLQEQLGRPVPGMLVKAGGFPRSRESC